MTVEVNDTIERYTLSGTGPYAFSWRIFDESDLSVTALESGDVDPVTLTLNSHYTVTGLNDVDGGSITLIGGANTTYAGFTLDIRSNTVLSQPTSIKNQGAFLPVIHETAFDRLSRQVQDIYRQVKQAFRYPDNVNLDGKMSNRSAWLAKYLYVNDDGEIEPATSIGSTALTQSSIGNVLYPRTAAEITVTPVNYSYPPGHINRFAVGGGADDTDAILDWINSQPDDGGVWYGDGNEYRINADIALGLLWLSKTNGTIHWNGTRFKTLDGESVVGGFDLMTLQDVQDFVIYGGGGALDQNRAGRTIPGEAGAYNLRIQNDCKRIRIYDMHFPNGVCDGITLTTTTPTVADSYPEDIYLIRCTGKNAYRNGGSAVAYRNFYLIDCEFSGANGLPAAQIGFDVEPDDTYTHNTGFHVIRGRYTDNPGGNIVVTGFAGTTNTIVRFDMPYLENGGTAALRIARAVDVKGSVDLGDQVGDAGQGLVQIGDASGAVSGVDLEVFAKGITSTVAKAVVNIGDNVTGTIKLKFNGTDLACTGVFNTVKADIDAAIRNCTSANPAVQNSGDFASIKVDIDTTTGPAVYNDAEGFKLTGRIFDCASATAAVQFESGADASDVDIDLHQRTSVPGPGIRYNNCAPGALAIRGTGGYTTTNIAGFNSGITGAKFGDIYPTVQTRTGAGAIDLTARVCNIVSTGANALTLAAGPADHEVLCTMTTDGGDATLTPTGLIGGTTITFDNVNDWALLRTNGSVRVMVAGTATLA